MPDAQPVEVTNVPKVEVVDAAGKPPVTPEKPTEKATEVTSKVVTSGAPPQPISTAFDDYSRLIMTVLALLSFDALVVALVWKSLLTPEMITLIIGLVGGWLGASWSFSFGSSAGSKNKDQERQVKTP